MDYIFIKHSKNQPFKIIIELRFKVSKLDFFRLLMIILEQTYKIVRKAKPLKY